MGSYPMIGTRGCKKEGFPDQFHKLRFCRSTRPSPTWLYSIVVYYYCLVNSERGFDSHLSLFPLSADYIVALKYIV